MKKFLAWFSTFRNLKKNVLEYQNGSEFAKGLIRPSLQSGFKKVRGQKKTGIPYFQAPERENTPRITLQIIR